MDGLRWSGVLAAALSLLPGAATAGPGVSSVTIRVQRQLTSVAIQAVVQGDDDSSAVLRIFQKWKGAPAFDTGMTLVRRIGTNLHEGRILWMAPERIVHYYVQARDAGGDYSTTVRVTKVRSLYEQTPAGPIFHVDQRLGNDAFDGRSPVPGGGGRGPTRTIGAALRLLQASPDAGTGGGVMVAPGEYHEQVTLPGGARGPRFLAGDGTARDSTIICGANPWVEQGLYAPGKPLSWKLTKDSTWVTRFPGSSSGSSPGDSTQLVVVGWGEYVHRKTSIRAVLNDSTWTGSPASSNVGELSGWFWRNDSLYVKRANGQSLVGQTLHTGYRDALIDVQGRDWRISGLTLRFAGGTSQDPKHPANPDPRLNGYGIAAGIRGVASGLVVSDCRLYGLNATAILATHGSPEARADSVTVTRCIIDGLTVGRMAYGAGKGRAEEDVGQVKLLSRAACFHENVLTGGFNGLQIGPGASTAGPTDSTWGYQNEITYNKFSHMADDAIELDTSHAINTLVLGNTIVDAGRGISQVPIYTGPVFVFYNSIANSRGGGVKVGEGSTGIAWYVHNTITESNPSSPAIDGGPGGGAENLHFRNNIFVTRAGPGGYTIWGPTTGAVAKNDFNYDLLDGAGPKGIVYWGGKGYTLAQLQSQLGWERNGLVAAPQFVDPVGENWSLTSASPGRGLGQRIAGVNTSLDGPLYSGKPDIGAQAQLNVTAGPEPIAVPRPRIVRALPNPSRGEGAIQYTLDEETLVTLRLYDVAGRVAATLLERAKQPAGEHLVPLPGERLAPGLYIVELRAGTQTLRGRITVLH